MDAEPPTPLDFARLWLADGQPPGTAGFPIAVATPAAQWSWGLQIPTCVKRPAAVRIAFRLANLQGKVRLGVVDGAHQNFIACAEFGDTDAVSAEIRLAADGRSGPLVAQNLSADGPTRFELVALNARIDPVYRHDHAGELQAYMQHGFDGIQGWCDHPSVAFLLGMDEAMFAHGVTGAVGEIGVHHGKLMIALHNLMAPGRRSVAIDVFSEDRFNLDRSGAGDRTIFLRNMADWAAMPENCLVVQGDSLVLCEPDWAGIEAITGKLKFFSIDGCHEAEHTLADIRSAMRLLAHGGVILVDDYLSQDFPGVHQAIATLYLQDRPPVAPFMIGHNKLYLTHLSHHAAYLELARMVISAIPGTHGMKPVRLYGHQALSWTTADDGPGIPVTHPGAGGAG